MAVTVTSRDSNYFKFKIPNFLERPEKHITSPKFKVTDLEGKSGDCTLRVYPKGYESYDFETADYICICLINESENIIKFSFDFSIEDKDGIKTNSRRFDGKSPERYCSNHNVLFAYIKIKHLKSQSDKLLSKGALNLILKIIKPQPESTATLFLKDMETAWLDDQFTDVKIVSKGMTFNCHKILLASRSPVFKSMFTSGFKESTSSVINLDSIQPEILKEFLYFIYCGKIKELEANAVALLKCADQYQVDNLKDICSHNLIQKLDVNNVLELLVLADMHNEEHLKRAAVNFALENIQCLMKTPQWVETKKKYPNLIIEVMEAGYDEINA